MTIIIVLLLVVGVVIFLVKTKKLDLSKFSSKFGKLGKSLFPEDSDKVIAKLDTETEKEKAKGDELRGVLEAKRRLLRAKAANTKIKKDIDTLTEDDLSVDFITPKSKK